MQDIPGLTQPQWWVPAQLTALLDAAQAADREADLQLRRQLLEDAACPPCRPWPPGNAHPVVAS